jgi:hypothetical protein
LTRSRPFNSLLDTLKRSNADQQSFWATENPVPVQALITEEIEGNQGDRCTISELGEHTVGPGSTHPLGGPFRFLP